MKPDTWNFDDLPAEEGKFYFTISFEGNNNMRMTKSDQFLNVLPVSQYKEAVGKSKLELANPRSLKEEGKDDDTMYLLYWPYKADKSIWEFEPA